MPARIDMSPEMDPEGYEIDYELQAVLRPIVNHQVDELEWKLRHLENPTVSQQIESRGLTELRNMMNNYSNEVRSLILDGEIEIPREASRKWQPSDEHQYRIDLNKLMASSGYTSNSNVWDRYGIRISEEEFAEYFLRFLKREFKTDARSDDKDNNSENDQSEYDEDIMMHEESSSASSEVKDGGQKLDIENELMLIDDGTGRTELPRNDENDGYLTSTADNFFTLREPISSKFTLPTDIPDLTDFFAQINPVYQVQSSFEQMDLS